MQTTEFGKTAQEKLLKGIKILAKSVKSTLGPGGRNVIFNKDGKTLITKDGVTVAKQINPSDPLEAMGADIIREASERTAFVAGDGTTTSAILAEAIAEAGYSMLASGLNAISLQRGIQSAARTITDYIKKNVVRECTPEQVRQTALVSTNWDEEIANLISEAVNKVGKDGSVTVQESHTGESFVKYVDGLEIERGYNSPYFVNIPEKNECVFENPFILLSGIKITNNAMLKPILEAAYNAGKGARPLLIIAPDVEHEALSTLVLNKVNGIMNLCSIKCPGFGDRMKDYMADLEALLGGTYFTDVLNRDFNTLQPEDFGTCEKVIINRDKTVFVNGGGDEFRLTNRINFIESLLANNPESWQARLYRERIAKLKGGVAVISVGAATEAELKERQDRVDDAVCSTRAALEGGVVPGGGATLAKIANNNSIKFEKGDYSFNVGVEIVRKAITKPLYQLLTNIGSEVPEIIISKVARKPLAIGYDVRSDAYVNMFDAGIIDPAQVTCSALSNAASVAGLILTTDCAIISEEQADK